MSRRSANGSLQWLAGEMPDATIQLVTAPLTLTAMTAVDSFIAGDSSYQLPIDAAGYRQVRLVGAVKTVSASANSPKLQLRYSAAYSTVIANKLIMGATSVEFSLFTGATQGDSGWIDLVPGAQINGLSLGLMAIGGDGAAAPVVNNVSVFFR